MAQEIAVQYEPIVRVLCRKDHVVLNAQHEKTIDEVCIASGPDSVPLAPMNCKFYRSNQIKPIWGPQG